MPLCIFVKNDFKSDLFVYTLLEHSSDEKKGDCIFSNSSNLRKLTRSKMAAICPRYYITFEIMNTKPSIMSICIVFKAKKLITLLYFRNKQLKIDFSRF